MPSAAYPTVLLKTLRGRYPSQASSMDVFNYGLGGEKVINARNRFFSALNASRPEVLLLMEGANDIPGGEDGAASGAASEIRIMASRKRSCAACACSSRRRRPPRPGGNRHRSDQFCSIDYANRMRARRRTGRRGAGRYLHRDVAGRDSATSASTACIRTKLGYATIADLFFQAIQATLEVR